MARTLVMSPIARARRTPTAVPPIPREWAGRTVGFLDNTKANFDRFTQDLGELLRERHRVKAIVHRRKANASTAAPPELVAQMAKDCDVVFAGSAD